VQRLLTPEEVAEVLAVPVETLRHWRYTRTGPPVIKVGKHLRYRPDALERWLEAREAESQN
jgi:excisionase family DNA binding protein